MTSIMFKPRPRSVKVGINGFGRIGRIFYRVCMGDSNIEVTTVNDLAEAKTLAHLLKYDSVHRTLPVDVESSPGLIKVGDREIKVFSERDPGKVNWGEEGVDVVVESTGELDKREGANKHIQGGAKLVVYSSTGKQPTDSDIILVYGVNHKDYIPGKHTIVANASCTTNSLAPICKILLENWGIVNGDMCTIHSYTADQRLWDTWHKDLRRARAAARSIIPTTTGAARTIGLILPELKDKMGGIAYRVPTLDVSVVHLVVDVKKDTTKEEVNKVFKEAAENEFKGIIQYVNKPLVSEDFVGNPHSTIIDAELTRVTERRKVTLVAWYDNEWGYACRLRDLIIYIAERNGWIDEPEAQRAKYAAYEYWDWFQQCLLHDDLPRDVQTWLFRDGGIEIVDFNYSVLKKMKNILQDQGVSDEDCEIPPEEKFLSLIRKYQQKYPQ